MSSAGEREGDKAGEEEKEAPILSSEALLDWREGVEALQVDAVEEEKEEEEEEAKGAPSGMPSLSSAELLDRRVRVPPLELRGEEWPPRLRGEQYGLQKNRGGGQSGERLV